MTALSQIIRAFLLNLMIIAVCNGKIISRDESGLENWVNEY
jgi:hypothetical protein